MKINKHIGDIYISKQGFTLRVIKWESRDKIKIEVLETGEEIWTDYWRLKRGVVMPNLYEYPPKGECTVNQAIFLSIGILSLFIAAIGGLIYWICV